MSVIAWRPAVQQARGASLAYLLLVLLIFALQFGPAIGLLGFRLTGDMRWSLIGILRDVLVMALVAVGTMSVLTAPRPLSASARWALVVVAAYGLFGLASSSGLFITALNLRRLALVPLLYVALFLIPWSRLQIEGLLRIIVGTCVAVAILGLAERLAPTSLWTDWLDIDRFTAANPLDRFGTIPFQESGRFFTWDLERWTGTPVRRMISTYLEPTTMAACMAVLLMCALASGARRRGSVFLVLIAIACGLATLSKAFGLFLIALLGWRLFGVPAPRHILSVAMVVAILALVAGETGHLEGPFEHVSGLASGLHYLVEGQFLGEGIGLAGGLGEGSLDVGHESGLGTAIGQVGLAAFIPLFWVRAIAIEVLGAARDRRDSGGPWLAFWLMFWMMSYLLSASSLGIGGNALGFAMLALYLHPSSVARSR